MTASSLWVSPRETRNTLALQAKKIHKVNGVRTMTYNAKHEGFSYQGFSNPLDAIIIPRTDKNKPINSKVYLVVQQYGGL